MPCPLRDRDQFLCSNDQTALPARPAAADGALSPSEACLAGMETVLSLTSIPDLGDFDSAEVAGDAEAARTNLVQPGYLSRSTDPLPNFLRRPRRSAEAQGRILALRRRQMRRQLRPGSTLSQGQDHHDIARLRACLYAAEDRPQPPSTQLRLATHAISLSLVATALPVGAAVMTYNLLKGEDMRVTARLTTLTGLALAVISGNPELAQIFGT